MCFKNLPHPSLAVALVAFNQKGEVLLNKRKIAPNPGSWDTVGGFVDVGETVEEAIKREFHEETQGSCEIVKFGVLIQTFMVLNNHQPLICFLK